MSQPTHPAPHAVAAHARQRVARLLELARTGAGDQPDFDGARLALECLPLSTGEFAAATNRLANAHAYLKTGERGAACFELRLLLRGLPSEPSAVQN